MKKKLPLLIAAVIILGAGYFIYRNYRESELKNLAGFVSGNGRLEATEVSISTKLAGRIDDILVDEGDFVKRGQHLAKMQTNVLEAQLAQAKAKHSQAVTEESSARAMIDVRRSEVEAAKAAVLQKESALDGARKRFERSKELIKSNATSKQQYDDDETAYLSAKAEVTSAQASVRQAEAAVTAAQAEAEGAKASIQAAQADIARIEADIDDSLLLAPREGRIQYRIAQPGEVLSAGGRVLNLVDLSDVYMTFFLPEKMAGKVRIGSEVRLIMDAVPSIPIPATVSYVASVAQFTPKTVETSSEREKLMFRVKARIAPELLKKYMTLVKTGIPGVAWVKLDPEAKWPSFLQNTKMP
ncbi:MAG: HlyD family efflux transporter periplasmic adaptor subunit [Lentisphaeria bacterium]|nr:HlyD family efflux transporter periplasmic adaptor subunit [Lentisphaeria bacterium]